MRLKTVFAIGVIAITATACPPPDGGATYNIAANTQIMESRPLTVWSNPGGSSTLDPVADADRVRDLEGYGNPTNGNYIRSGASGLEYVDPSGNVLIDLGVVWDVLISVDGSTLAAIAWPGAFELPTTITVYDLPSGTIRHSITGAGGSITLGFDMSPDGTYIAYRDSAGGGSLARTRAPFDPPTRMISPAQGCARFRVLSNVATMPRIAGSCSRPAGFAVISGGYSGAVLEERVVLDGLTTGTAAAGNNVIADINTGKLISQMTDGRIVILDDVPAAPIHLVTQPALEPGTTASIGGRALPL